MFEQQLVKPPQSRHGRGRSTVHLAPGAPWGMPDLQLYVKTQEDYNCRPVWRLWQSTPTFLCETSALKACHALGMNVPNLMSFRHEGDIAELVLEEISDAMPLHIFWVHASGERLNDVMFNVGHMVGLMHRAGWVHRALYPGHILIQPNAQDKASIIDFEKARRVISKRSFVSDLARFWRHCRYLKGSNIYSFFDGYGSVLPENAHDLTKQAFQIRRTLVSARAPDCESSKS